VEKGVWRLPDENSAFGRFRLRRPGRFESHYWIARLHRTTRDISLRDGRLLVEGARRLLAKATN